MRLTWLAYNYKIWDGYGRFSLYMVQALERAGVSVDARLTGLYDAPGWMRERWGVDFSAPTVSCLPPFYLRKLPKDATGEHWLLTMTEGSECPDGWAETINKSGVSRVIVPCEHNAEVFRSGGVEAPISVIHGGTDPDEFALLTERPDRPYTFLALADRGNRKGYGEVWQAFYKAFGGKTTGVQDVRLMVKSRPDGNALLNNHVRHAIDLDQRLIFNDSDVEDMRDLYALADCFAIPSRSEGWGMPHREAAMCGLPVITQRYSGMDDGHTDKWALVVEGGQLTPVNATKDGHIKGFCRRVDVDELAARMRWCYDNRAEAAQFGQQAAQWLRQWQTWDHTADALIGLLQHEDVLEREYAVWP